MGYFWKRMEDNDTSTMICKKEIIDYMDLKERKTVDTREYVKRFNAWDRGVSNGGDPVKRETLYSQDYGNAVAFTPRDDEIFVQCYTANKSSKYYKARHRLPKYWFISQYGNLVSFYSEAGNYVKPTPTGKPNKRREAYKPSYLNKSDGPSNLEVGLLVALSFEYESSTHARELLDKQGLKALKRKQNGKKYVEIHHQCNGYKYAEGPETPEETFARRAENCQRKKLWLGRNDEHNVSKTEDEIKIVMDLPHAVTDKKNVTFVKYPGKHGTFNEFVDPNFMYLYVNAEYVNTDISCFYNEDKAALENALIKNSSITIDALKMAISINRHQPEGQTGIEYEIPIETGQTIPVVIRTME